MQFLQLYPANIAIMKEVAGYGAIFAADGLGLSMWNTLDESGLSWTAKIENAKYVAAGADGHVLVVGKDSRSLTLLRAFDGQLLASSVLDDGVVGEPLQYEGAYLILQKGKVTVLDNNLSEVIVLKVDGLSGRVEMRQFDGGLLLSNGQSVWKLTLAGNADK